MKLSVTKQGVLCLFLWFVLGLFSASAQAVFINEIHYDNVSADSGEAVELAGEAGVDLTDWSLMFYRGEDQTAYKTKNLSGVFPDMQAGFGVLGFSISGIQNGSPDGVALVNADNVVTQFLSYEGSFTAIGGPANGLFSTDIGVSEDPPVTVDFSLQLSGTGNTYNDFVWGPAMLASFGTINAGQTFVQVDRAQKSVSVPEPDSLYLLVMGMLGLVITGWKNRSGRNLFSQNPFNQNQWRPAGNAPVPV